LELLDRQRLPWIESSFDCQLAERSALAGGHLGRVDQSIAVGIKATQGHVHAGNARPISPTASARSALATPSASISSARISPTPAASSKTATSKTTATAAPGIPAAGATAAKTATAKTATAKTSAASETATIPVLRQAGSAGEAEIENEQSKELKRSHEVRLVIVGRKVRKEPDYCYSTPVRSKSNATCLLASIFKWFSAGIW
jgi:hypothetical protein